MCVLKKKKKTREEVFRDLESCGLWCTDDLSFQRLIDMCESWPPCSVMTALG